MTPQGHITTLGRGGSDYSAVLFADMLDLKEVDIYTDVDGVYDNDPKLNSYAIKYDKLTYDNLVYSIWQGCRGADPLSDIFPINFPMAKLYSLPLE